jgi:hypothetical protein
VRVYVWQLAHIIHSRSDHLVTAGSWAVAHRLPVAVDLPSPFHGTPQPPQPPYHSFSSTHANPSTTSAPLLWHGPNPRTGLTERARAW